MASATWQPEPAVSRPGRAISGSVDPPCRGHVTDRRVRRWRRVRARCRGARRSIVPAPLPRRRAAPVRRRCRRATSHRATGRRLQGRLPLRGPFSCCSTPIGWPTRGDAAPTSAITPSIRSPTHPTSGSGRHAMIRGCRPVGISPRVPRPPPPGPPIAGQGASAQRLSKVLPLRWAKQGGSTMSVGCW